MIQINPLKSYIDGGVRAALTTPPSASLVFDLPGKAIWVKGVKLKGTDHTYTFSHDNYITLTNTPDSNESEDIKIGVNTSALKSAIDTTYGVVSTTANGLAPKFTSGNKLAATAATTYYFLGWTGTTLKWYQTPFRNIRINSETTDCLGVNNTDPLIIGSGNGISVTWDSTNKKIIITNTKPDINHNTDTKVALSVTTLNKNYAIILKGNDSDEGSITTVNFSTYLKFNPSTKLLTINGNKVITTIDTFVGATTSADGSVGLVTKPLIANRLLFLRGDGTWATPTDTWRPVKVEGTEKLGSNALDLSAGNGISIIYNSDTKKIVITNTKPDVNHNTDRTGIKLTTVSGTKKTDSTLILANSTTGLGIQGGTNKFLIGNGTNYIEVPVVPSVSNKDATIGTTLTTVATVAGVDIKAKIASYSLSNHTHSVTINDSTKTITTSGTVDLGNYLPLSGGTMNLGEGLKFHADENYFGTNLDARIISLLDGNDTTCDGGLIIDERAIYNGIEYVTELLRIRDTEFKWKSLNILHAGNSSVSRGGSTWGSSITVKINGTSKTLTIPGNPNTDYRVTQSETTTANYRPLVLGYTSVNTAGSGMTGSVTNQVYLSNKFYVQPSTGNLYATNFVGALYGNASSATKLQTPRTIWGQSFDGTANVDNTLRIRLTTGNYCEGIRIQTSDGAWSTIILGATADSGTNTNAWSIHRKADNNFAISRNSSDGTNGLVMTSVGMGLGTTTPTQRLDVRGNTTITGSITASSAFINTGDSTLKVYSGIITDAKSDGNICLQTSIDRTDGQSHAYPTQYGARCNLVLLPRGGQVYIGTNPDGGNTTYKLYTNGDIYSSTYIRAANGFVKGGSSNSCVLLGGGGHKLESSLNVANADTVDGYHANSFAFIENTYGTAGNFVNGIENSNYIARGDLGLVGFDNSTITVELYEAASGNSYLSSPTKTITTADTTYGINFKKGTLAIMHTCAKGSKLKIIVKTSNNYIKAVGIYVNLGGKTISFSSTVADITKIGKMSTYGSWHIFSCMGKIPSSITLELNTTNVDCEIIIGGFRTYITNPYNLRFPGVANLAESVSWSNITNKPSSFTPSSHTHNYLPLSGGSLTGTLRIDCPTSLNNNYNEGIRCNLGGKDNLASVVLGGANGSTYGSGNGVYSLLVNSNLFRIRQNSTEVITINTSNNVGIGTISPSYKFHVIGDIYTTTGFKKNGSSDSYVLLGGGGHKAISDFMLKTDELSNNLITISKSLTVTKDWMDTDIKNTDLPANGTYIIQVSANNTADNIRHNYWSGIMSWYKDGTDDSDSDEIILHRAGHAYGHTIYLRTIMTTSSDGRHLRLQIAADTNLSTAVTYTFKFKRVI